MMLMRLFNLGKTKMKGRKFFRDDIEEVIVGDVKTHVTRDGHTIEKYTLENGDVRFFATISGMYYCAHGDTEAEAIADALWKDESKRPSMDALKKEIQKAGIDRMISLNEFRILTGACKTGAMAALRQKGLKPNPMTAKDVRDKVSKEWGEKLISVLGWNEVLG